MHRITTAIIGLLTLTSAFAAGKFKNQVTITEDQYYRYIKGNGIPDHTPGRFPNRKNPNRISEQTINYRVPLYPKAARAATKIGHWPFGVATNGVPFDPNAAEFWNRDRTSGWQYEAMSGKVDLGLDQSSAHVQPTGSYHYHGLPHGLIRLKKGQRKMTLIGWAADGFPIYNNYGYADASDPSSGFKEIQTSYQVKKGKRPSGPGGKYDGIFVQDWEYVAGSGDLDEHNGRFGVTPEHPKGIYHYHITDAYPFIPRSMKGIPDASFVRRGPGGGGFRMPWKRPPPPGGYPAPAYPQKNNPQQPQQPGSATGS